jgi:hypothetical protein
MRDVTDVLNTYRECLRHIWNAYFAPDARGDTDWDSVEDFDTASGYRFRALVLRKIEREEAGTRVLDETLAEPLLFLRIDRDPCGEILINRQQSRGYWDHPLRTVEKGDLDLALLGYFDWDVTGHRDLAYYRTRIVDSSKYPDVVGKDALVPIGPHVRVLQVRGATEREDAPDEVHGEDTH